MEHNLFRKHNTYVIAEASGNHRKSKERARNLVLMAHLAGADAIKFQTFEPDEIAADVPIPRGHDPATDAWLDGLGVASLRDLFVLGGLPRGWHAELKEYAEGKGLDFISTPFSVDAARFLVEEIGIGIVKVASGDITFKPLHDYLRQSGIPVVMSTGGATIEEITLAAVDIAGYKRSRLAILHCRSIYPCPLKEIDLRCIAHLKTIFGHIASRFGLSDHTLSFHEVPFGAVCAGARVIEKHIRLLHDTDSVDAAHSLDPMQFATMVQNIRMAETLMGHGAIGPLQGERHDRYWARRSAVDWLRPTEEARRGQWE